MTDELAVTGACVPVVADTSGPLAPSAVVGQVTLIQEVMKAVMKDGEHYGTIPGCGDKPSLLNPGAQKLAMTFRLAPKLDVQQTDLGNGHREYMIRCDLVSIASGQLVGSGVGSCSTMESKYRYRNVADFEITGEEIPKDAKERKQEYRRQGFGMKKVDGTWEWVKYKDSGKVENPDIADTYNTVLKMAKKRAFVDAVLTTTAASDIFTQDIEDLPSPEAVSASVTPAAPSEGTQGAKSAEAVVLVDKKTLKRIRDLRKKLEVSDDNYAVHLDYCGVSSDDKLPADKAQGLLATYEAKLAEKNAEPTVPDTDDTPF